MERAGLAAAQIARELGNDSGDRVLIIAGPGNNGGDAFVMARHLKAWHHAIEVVFAGDAAKLPAAAKAAFDAWRASGGATLAAIPDGWRWKLVVDGLFGIGLQRALDTSYAALVQTMNRIEAPLLALDVPSGLDADTGRVLGCAVEAEHTATFIALKPGLLTLDGPDYCGDIRLCPLDLDAAALGRPPGATIGSDLIKQVLPERRANSHKGDYGNVGLIGGARGMTGAALLAARAALKLGSGRVYVGVLNAVLDHDPLQLELMPRAVEEILKLPLDCIAIGPGLGQSPDAHSIVQAALHRALPLVIDADALNLIAADKKLQSSVSQRTMPTVLTPHPAEAARLLGCTTTDVQADRIRAACEIAARYRAFTVLKGAGSICAAPDGAWFVNTTGNPGMASAGMGDALTGIVAAFIAQGADPQQALLAAVHLHGAAADEVAATLGGPLGVTASEVITAARAALNRARERQR